MVGYNPPDYNSGGMLPTKNSDVRICEFRVSLLYDCKAEEHEIGFEKEEIGKK